VTQRTARAAAFSGRPRKRVRRSLAPRAASPPNRPTPSIWMNFISVP